jgi:signal peptidase II
MSDDVKAAPTGDAPEPHREEPSPTADDGPDSAPAPPLPVYKPDYVFLGVVSAVSLALDLGSKWWAVSRLEGADPFTDRRVEVIEGFMSFVFARNKGGAWGLLQNESEAIRRPFFVLISIVAIAFIVSLYRKLTPQQLALKWGLPLVLGGALGNLVDRVRYGHVVDFIDVYATWGGKLHRWPTFNIADVAICVGVGLMAVDMFTSRKTKTSPAPVAPALAAREPPSKPGS